MIDFDKVFETDLQRIDKKINEIEDCKDAQAVARVADCIIDCFNTKSLSDQEYTVQKLLVASYVGWTCNAQAIFKEQGLKLMQIFTQQEDIDKWYKEMQGVERVVGKSPFSIYYEAFMLAPEEMRQAAMKSVAENIDKIVDCD